MLKERLLEYKTEHKKSNREFLLLSNLREGKGHHGILTPMVAMKTKS